MNAHQDIVHGGGGVAALGWVVTAWTWLTGGASPLTVLATVLTIILTALKIYDAVKRMRKGRPVDSGSMPLGDR